jgi:STE24 endopeptidase
MKGTTGSVRKLLVCTWAACAAAGAVGLAAQETASSPQPPPASAVQRMTDPEAATRAYIARMPPEQKARSDAYFEGGYWLILWNFAAVAGVSLLLLGTRLSARMRNLSERIAPGKAVQTFLFMAQYTAVTAVILFPFTYWRDFVREHAYGLATQTLPAWLGDRAKGLAITAVFGGLLVTAVYGVLRRARNWWIWGALVTLVFLMFFELFAPIYVLPLFNKVSRLEDPKIRDPILSLARANGIGVQNVFVVDASRQTTRISANVSGFLGTERITLNDNLLKRCTVEEIEAVMGHEMGHYVLNHTYKGVVFFGLIIVLGFAYLRWSFDRMQARYGARWDVRGVGDPAGLPLLALLFAFYLFVLTPVLNTIVRTQEYEADLFGLNAARQPDGFASTALKLSDYRKIAPTPFEEAIFYDHPSGHTRIFSAMRWKAEHPEVK